MHSPALRIAPILIVTGCSGLTPVGSDAGSGGSTTGSASDGTEQPSNPTLGTTLGTPAVDSSTSRTTTADSSTSGTTAADSSTADSSTSGTTAADSSASGTTTAIGTETDGPAPPMCPSAGEGMLEDGESCASNSECVSGVCVVFHDAPLDPGAACGPASPDCATRIIGTTLDIVTQTPLAAELRVAGLLQAVTNPRGATALATAATAEDGRVDTVTDEPLNAALGIVALTSTPTSSLTGTAIAAPIDGVYGLANDVHDLWTVPEDAAAAWSAALALDPDVDPANLPLGPAGGIVGLARDTTGQPMAGVEIVSEEPASAAVVRFLEPGGSFNDDATTDRGLFVIVNPALAESFEAIVDGEVVGSVSVLSVEDAIFTIAFTIE